MHQNSMSHVPAHPGQPVRIDPDAWYTDPDLRLILGLPGATLQRARRSGALRHSRRGMQVFHSGKWVIRWLAGQEVKGGADAR